MLSTTAGYFVGELSDWVCWHSNHADKLMAIITDHRSPDSNRENYWTLVCLPMLSKKVWQIVSKLQLQTQANYVIVYYCAIPLIRQAIFCPNLFSPQTFSCTTTLHLVT